MSPPSPLADPPDMRPGKRTQSGPPAGMSHFWPGAPSLAPPLPALAPPGLAELGAGLPWRGLHRIPWQGYTGAVCPSWYRRTSGPRGDCRHASGAKICRRPMCLSTSSTGVISLAPARTCDELSRAHTHMHSRPYVEKDSPCAAPRPPIQGRRAPSARRCPAERIPGEITKAGVAKPAIGASSRGAASHGADV